MTTLYPAITFSTVPRLGRTWPARDLIRLWPWLLPVVLFLVIVTHGFGDGFMAMISGLSAWGFVWMTFLIARRFWGHHRAHATANTLMLAFGTFSFMNAPMSDMDLFIINSASAGLYFTRVQHSIR